MKSDPQTTTPHNELKNAALNYLEVVGEMFAIREDGPCYAERKPSKDTSCLAAFINLKNTGAELRRIIDATEN